MQRKEPSAGLIDTFCNEVGGINFAEILTAQLERIVHLCIRHSARIEPNIDQIAFAYHPFSFRRYQHNVIDIRTVQIKFIVILFREVTLDIRGKRVFGHEAGSD